MKSLKFFSLILLCATSSLALILPALGVVPFPSQFVGANGVRPDIPMGGEMTGSSNPSFDPQRSSYPQLPPAGGGNLSGNGNSPSPVLPTSDSWRPAPPSLGLSSMAGVPVSTNQSGIQTGGPMDPRGMPGGLADGATATNGAVYDSSGAVVGTKHKVGMGLWLLLAPLWLLSLLVWSVAPNPSGGGRPPFRRAG